MEPLTLAALSGAALAQGITFLYTQAGEILKARRERKAKAANSEVPIAPTAAEAVEGTLKAVTPDWTVVEELADELRELRQRLSDYLEGGIEAPDPSDETTLRTTDALRRAVELVLGQRITLKGEQRAEGDPVVAGRVEVAELRGYAAAVRAAWISGGRVTGEATVETVHEGGQVIGVDAHQIGERDG